MSIAILGGGNMGLAIARGLLKARRIAPEALTFGTPHPEKVPIAELGCRALADNAQAVAGAEVVVLAVKPRLVAEVLREVVGSLAPGALILSVAAGVTLAALREALGVAAPGNLVRAMPNTAVSLGEGVVAYAAETPEAAARADELLSALGLALRLEETRFSAVTALSGCGIAHALRFLRAAQEAGVQMGLSAQAAGEIFAQTMVGAARLVLENKSHPEAEVDRVCTPGGLTIRGLNAMDARGFTGAVVAGILASGTN